MAAARILIVEEEIIIARELEARLQGLGYEVVGIAASGPESLALAEQTQPQLVLMDIVLKGDGDGIAAAAEMRRRWSLPIIYLTAYADQATLQRAKTTEPFGYIVKPFSERELQANIEMALYKHRVESKLRLIEKWFSASMQRIADGVILTTKDDGTIRYLNRVAELLTGWPSSKAIGRKAIEVFRLVSRGRRTELEDPVARTLREGIVTEMASDVFLIDGNNEDIPVDYTGACLRDEAGNPTGVVLVFRDLSEPKRAEELRRKADAQALQAQKLESLGILAGGIAHDFNNLLTTILGYADLARSVLPPDSSPRNYIDEVMKGARQAADLTAQMLAYSGKGRFVVGPLHLSTLVADMGRLLEISISKHSVLRYRFTPNLPACEADAAQMRQIIMNLISNASDAIGERSGMITVSTGVRHCDRAYLSESYFDENLPEGPYVYLEVADTGCGMSEETRVRVFDPFFTTKFTGRGLGLAAVLGIVRGHHGVIKVHSELDQGTTFTVLFPATTAPATREPARTAGATSWRGSGTVLIVDDEEVVRELARQMLETMGFTVLTAADGREGVEVFRREADRIRLVLLDLTMPHLHGTEAHREMQRIRGDVKAILSSGYDEQTATNQFAGKGQPCFVQKPYTYEALVKMVRKVLEN